MIGALKQRWHNEGGYKQLLKLAIPLVLSTSSWAILHFVDRMFLSWYSKEALAAAMPAGILNFALISLFVGTAGYSGTFVAQYFGAGDHKKIGKVLWHTIYISILGALFVLAFIPLATPIFNLIGHAKQVKELEITYFKVLCFGVLGPILSAGFGGFFSGRGKNWPVMWVNFTVTAINLILDFLLIFGPGPFPELGIFGAALATVIAGLSGIGIYSILIFRPHLEKKFKVLSAYKFDKEYFLRFLKFGLPSGMHFFLDMIGFTIFLLIIGRIGTDELAATNIAFNINTLAFMPMIGFGIAVSLIVGQSIGEGNIAKARYATFSAAHLTFSYMSLFAVFYFFFPDVFILPFAIGADPVEFAPIRSIALILLRFVAVYSLFDTMSIIFASAIKGAGDTKFVMLSGIGLSFGVLVIPSFICIIILKTSLYVAWFICTAYILLMGIIYLGRFLQGKWQNMKVIETHAGLPTEYPVNPFDVNGID